MCLQFYGPLLPLPLYLQNLFPVLQATLQAPESNEETYKRFASDPEKKSVTVSLPEVSCAWDSLFDGKNPGQLSNVRVPPWITPQICRTVLREYIVKLPGSGSDLIGPYMAGRQLMC